MAKKQTKPEKPVKPVIHLTPEVSALMVDLAVLLGEIERTEAEQTKPKPTKKPKKGKK